MMLRRVVPALARLVRYRCTDSQQSRTPAARHLQVLQVRRLNAGAACTEPVGEEEFEGVVRRLCGDDGEKEKYLRVIQMEVEIGRQEGLPVPDHITQEEWAELMSLDTRPKRRKFLRYLFLTEKSVENERRKKELKRQKREEELRQKAANQADTLPDDPSNITYGLSGCTIFMRIRDHAITQFLNAKLMEAIQFEPTIVVDCGYDQYMVRQEHMTCANQLQILFAENRMHTKPFRLMFCNANPQAPTMKFMERFIPTLYDPHFPLEVTQQDYLELYPKDKLVYLTPHCKEELSQYNPDDVYVIGAMVDKRNTDHLSLAKAKKQGIRMAKLPLDKYLSWGGGSGKSLTVNQVIQIMLEIKDSGDWDKALTFVPRRKLFRDDEPNKFSRDVPRREKRDYYHVKSLFKH